MGGLSVDLGLTGIRMHLDTLESLVRGGVSFATPGDAGDPVRTGHRFTLHGQPDDDWLEWRPSAAIGHSLLPPGTPLPRPQRASQTWTEGRFWSSDEQLEGWVLVMSDQLVGPIDLLTASEDAHEDTAFLEVAGVAFPVGEVTPYGAGLGTHPLDQPLPVSAWKSSRLRAPTAPEDCLLVGDPGLPPHSLAAGRMTPADDHWELDPALSFDERWHGACVVARSDGFVIGMLLVDDDDGARIVALPAGTP